MKECSKCSYNDYVPNTGPCRTCLTYNNWLGYKDSDDLSNYAMSSKEIKQLTGVTYWNFEVEGGRSLPKGKPHWPNRINLQMTIKQAFDLVLAITSKLKHSEGDEVMEYNIPGELTEFREG